MTTTKVLLVCEALREKLKKLQIHISCFPDDKLLPYLDHGKALAHCLWMVVETEKLAVRGRTEKALFRLGFVGGVMWAFGVLTIGEIKELCNKPE